VNYATWKLNFTNPDYGTGPEAQIAELGATAQAAWIVGQAHEGGTILGYVTEPQDETKLSAWDFANITQEEALAFCQEIDSEAYLLEDGMITYPIEKIEA